MDNLIFRLGALLAHALLNVVLVSWLLNFDISSRWIYVIGFFIILFVLLVIFIRHFISFVNFIKTKTK